MKRPEDMSYEEIEEYIDDQLFMQSLEKKRVLISDEAPILDCDIDKLIDRKCLVEEGKIDKLLNEIRELKDEVTQLKNRDML